MSDTTPKASIISANSVKDILAAAEDDPEIKAALHQGLIDLVANRSLLGTRTFWVAILTPIVSFAATRWGLGLDAATCGEIAAGLTSLAAVGMRAVTSTPVTVLPKADP